MSYKNLAWFTIGNTPGTAGDFTVSAAVDELHVTLGAADDGLSFSTRILETGVGSEVRTSCLYTHSTATLSRGTLESSTSGSALSFTSAAQVQIIGESAATALLVNRVVNHGAVRTQGTGTNQTISSTSTFTKVTCMQADYDALSYWNNTNKVIRPTLAGRYLLLFSGLISGIDDGKRIIFRVGVDESGGGTLDSGNAQSFDLLRAYSSLASGFVGGTCAAVVEADGTRSFGILAWQDSSSAAAVQGSTTGVSMYMQYLGPIV